MLKELTIITITFNNPDELNTTYLSLKDFRDKGGKQVIINGGASVKHLIESDCTLIEEPDNGIYDALNKGIALITTDYFMLIHSGDFLASDAATLALELGRLKDDSLDILLNNCSIQFGNGKRLMNSRFWRPWMFKLGAQPPHPPIIYRKSAVEHIKYDVEHKTIADFKYLEDLFANKINYSIGNCTLVHMTSGGVTSSGIKSFFHVNQQFKKLKGPKKAIMFAIFRPFIKLLQML